MYSIKRIQKESSSTSKKTTDLGVQDKGNSKPGKDLIDIAIETRKIEKKTNKLKSLLWEDNIKAFSFSIHKIHEILNLNGIVVTDYTWRKYIEGMNGIEIVSVEKNWIQEQPIIYDSITPLVEVDGAILIKSKVIILSS